MKKNDKNKNRDQRIWSRLHAGILLDRVKLTQASETGSLEVKVNLDVRQIPIFAVGADRTFLTGRKLEAVGLAVCIQFP